MIVVWDLPHGAEYAPMLSSADRRKLDAVEARWGDLCREIGGKHQLPDGWLQAMIWRESNGNPRARNPEGTPNPDNDGIGLLQITSRALKGPRTDEQLFDPRTNIEIGAGYISYLASLKSTRGSDGKPDFARIAAAFNAGSVRPSRATRWGMHATGNHIDEEVCALNSWTAVMADRLRRTAAIAAAAQFSGPELLGPDFDEPAGLRDDEPPPTDRNT